MLVALAVLLVASVVVYFALGPAPRNRVGAPASRPTSPAPGLPPFEVTAAILAALKDNDDATDEGIRTTFRFASPQNQAATGPVDRFVEMVKRPPYDRLVNHRASRVRPLDLSDTQAAAVVKVIDPDGRPAWFLWQLSKQPAGPFKDCWMTDAVLPARRPADEPPDEPI